MTDLAYHHIAAQFYNRPLWLLPSAAETISAFLLMRMRRGQVVGGSGSDAGSSTQAFAPSPHADGSVEFHAPRASRFYGEYPVDPDGNGRPKPYRRTADGTAIVTVVGELVNRGAYVGASSGVVSYEGIKFQLLQAAADPRARCIVIDMESPGGEAIGAFEAAAIVRQVARVKPVYAVVNGLAASAGYALASGATRIITMPTGISGSIASCSYTSTSRRSPRRPASSPRCCSLARTRSTATSGSRCPKRCATACRPRSRVSTLSFWKPFTPVARPCR